MDKVEQLTAKFNTLPASPVLLPRLARLLENLNKTDVYEIVDVVMYDSALTAKLVQIANSAYFGNHIQIANVGEAMDAIRAKWKFVQMLCDLWHEALLYLKSLLPEPL
jgi:HD-like signal output (HDOD) protein